MSHNSFGNLLKFTTWGESHGEAIGCVVDGFPANIKIDVKYIQKKLDLRKPGQSKFTTQRNEDDKIKILSGVFEGKSTGTPISIIIYNEDKKLFYSLLVDGPIKFTKNQKGEFNVNNISKYGKSFSIVKVPYTLKLLIQELQSMNIQLRIITEDNMNQLPSMSYSDNIIKLTNKSDIAKYGIDTQQSIRNELEKEKRGVYGGGCGYFSANGEMDIAIALRTAILKDQILYSQAGGGVVFDSDPESEFQETVNKSNALWQAAQNAKDFVISREDQQYSSDKFAASSN